MSPVSRLASQRKKVVEQFTSSYVVLVIRYIYEQTGVPLGYLLYSS